MQKINSAVHFSMKPPTLRDLTRQSGKRRAQSKDTVKLYQ